MLGLSNATKGMKKAKMSNHLGFAFPLSSRAHVSCFFSIISRPRVQGARGLLPPGPDPPTDPTLSQKLRVLGWVLCARGGPLCTGFPLATTAPNTEPAHDTNSNLKAIVFCLLHYYYQGHPHAAGSLAFPMAFSQWSLSKIFKALQSISPGTPSSP